MQTKRRRISLYSLPVVVAIGFLLVAKLAALQQSDIVADLADRIAHGETREASEAVLKLAAMPNPPVTVLVTAAAADEHQTADAGQVAINKLLRRWQHDVEHNHRSSATAAQLCELAEELDRQQHDFSNSDRQWLAITAGKILRLANALPAAKTPLVAIHCDAVLAAVDAGGSISVSGDVDETPTSESQSSKARTATAASQAATTSVYKPAQPRFVRESASADNRGNAAPNQPSGSRTFADTDPLSNLEDGTASELPAAPADGNGHEKNAETDDELSGSALVPPRRFNNADWSRPIMRILPAKPDDQVIGSPPAKTVLGDNEYLSGANPSAGADDGLEDAESKELLQRLRTADDDSALPIERELGRRGFGKVTPRLAQQFFSDDAEERIHLVKDVMAMPGGGAGAWLVLLADDPDADVRLFAVTLMTTSNNSMLLDKAWDVALRDHDPRIADLAGRLRERRSGTLRR